MNVSGSENVRFHWLDNGPWMLYILYIASAASKVGEIVSVLGLRYRWGRRIVLAVSSVGFCVHVL